MTMQREYKTKKITVGNVTLGGGEKIKIQSRTTTKTADVEKTVAGYMTKLETIISAKEKELMSI